MSNPRFTAQLTAKAVLSRIMNADIAVLDAAICFADFICAVLFLNFFLCHIFENKNE